MHLGHGGEVGVVGLGAQAGLLPILTEVLLAPDLHEVIFVIGGPTQRRVALLPGHPLQPFMDVLVLQRRLGNRRVGLGLRALHGLTEGPRNLPKLESAAVAATALKGVGKSPAIQPHGG